MSLQDLFYITAIVFMVLVTIIILLLATAYYKIVARINQITESTNRLIDQTTNSSQRVFNQIESFFPKIIEAISIGELVKTMIDNYQESKKSKTK